MKAADKNHTMIESKHDLITQEVSKVVNKLVQEVVNSKALKKMYRQADVYIKNNSVETKTYFLEYIPSGKGTAIISRNNSW